MQTDQHLSFGPYRFSPQTGQLWRGKHEVSLTKKAIALLRYLVERAGQVVAKEELFQTVWTDSVVSDAALTSCVQELRQALHDNARKPRYLETVHRRGFRFIAPLNSTFPLVSGSRFQVSGAPAAVTPDPRETWNVKRETPVVGRDTDLTRLHGWLAKALTGERQIIFVTGEPGIGKTTLIEHFVFEVRSRKEFGGQKLPFSTPNFERPSTPRWWVGQGQCIEHYGAGEAYLPILEALGRLCREPDGQRLVGLLKQHAPTWLVQMPALLNPDEIEALQRKTAGATRERMLRELAEALEVITTDHPLIFVLEDLHWSDVSTLDLLSMLARRQEPARLMILGTYRPVEVLTRDHPLKGIKQELQLHGQCTDLTLDFLSEQHVEEYLAVRFPLGQTGRLPLQRLAHVVHQRTDGNPLFMVNVTNELVMRGVEMSVLASLQSLEELGIGVPENLRQLIEQQIARVSPDERHILEAASVAGAEFSAATVAAGTAQTTEAVETYCDDLVRRELFLRPRGTSEWPDGTVSTRYGFMHALYQDVLYDQLSASRRIRLHRQIGEREEQSYGERAREIAAELAVHFEHGRDYHKAVQYLQQAGENAVRRSAHQEAINLLTRGLELLKTLPDTPDRAQQEFTLQIALGVPLMATNGYAHPQVGSTYARALELGPQFEDPHQLSLALDGFLAFCLVRAEHGAAGQLAKQLLSLARNGSNTGLLAEAHRMLGEASFWLGDSTKARSHLEQSTAVYDPQQHRGLPFLYGGPDIEVANRAIMACVLWHLGYPDQARRSSDAALGLAEELTHPLSQAFALDWATTLWQYRHEIQEAEEQTEALIALSVQHGFFDALVGGKLAQGWMLVEWGQGKEGIPQICQSLATYQAAGVELGRPTLLGHLARAYGKVGQIEKGLQVLTEALAIVDKTGERVSEAELYRLKGELTLQSKQVEDKSKPSHRRVKNKSEVSSTQHLKPSTQAETEAEECFVKAIEVARKQQAKSLELRAATSLARLRQRQSHEHTTRTTQHVSCVKLAEAHKTLSEIYNWFTEGFDTNDLQEAKVLLEELSQ